MAAEAHKVDSAAELGGVFDEKNGFDAKVEEMSLHHGLEFLFKATTAELSEAKTTAAQMSLAEVKTLFQGICKMHESDPNFPVSALEKINEFLGNADVFANPDKHEDLIYEMKLEAALMHNNSPYAEVRAVVENHDDASIPSSTVRAWAIGLGLAAGLGFVNQLFSIRRPQITIGANVAQLLAFPLGKLWERTLPDWGVTVAGTRISLNPGPFSKKEHMLITIMANVGSAIPYSYYIIWTQYLPQYFDQPYSGSFGYQIIISLAISFIGYGMAGLARRFLVYPAHCVWPASLVTIALNRAFHADSNSVVAGPFGKTYAMSRYRFFMLAFAAMFVYFWLPNYVFTALSVFSWMSWIAPDNVKLNGLVGMQNGLGLNPWPTFDWNILLFDSTDPLMVPFFSTLNKFLGMFFSMFVVVGLWFSNAFYTAYLPINSNRVYDNTASAYNVSRAIDKKGLFDAAQYESYSPAYMAAGNLTNYVFFFALYPATLMYIYLHHWYEIQTGFRNLTAGFRRNRADAPGPDGDVHNRLMARYAEAPEWWYMALLATAAVFGIAGVAGWPTYTSPGVVFFGLALCLVFVVPVGIIKSMTGIEVTLNVLAEFIGGSWAQGNALATNFFKAFGYVTCAHAVWFANDLKLAHYVKIPPRQTFWAQIAATLVSTFVCVAILNFQMKRIPDVCQPNQPDHYTCPEINTFFTAAVLWGTIGPQKVFGTGGHYTTLLVGWPLGLVFPVLFWALRRKWPRARWLRQAHPIAMLYGAIYWAPYNLSYVMPAVPIAWLSWIFVKERYVAFWAKYNFVLSAAFSSGIAVAAIIIFFALQLSGTELSWWGNEVVSRGCEGDACVLVKVGDGGHFGPGVGEFG